jgi:DNA-binding HxlR family transcriptional regulator
MNTDCTKNTCPVVATLNMIGGKYKAIILWHLVNGTRRFGELQRLIPQATQKMLTQQLRELENDNLITRTVYPVVPPKVEYKLSDLGQSITPVLNAMRDWGTSYMEITGADASCFMVKL